MKKIVIFILSVLFFSSAWVSAQVDLSDHGYKYHAEEFIFFNWNNQKPIIYVFNVETGFDGPKMVRHYRAWYSVNGKWFLFLDDTYNTEDGKKSPLDDILQVRKDEKGNRFIEVKYENVDVRLSVLDQITTFTSDASGGRREITTGIHQGMLLENGAAMNGVVVHNYRQFRGENPMLPDQNIKLYGPNYDRAYMFTAAGDVIIATNTGHMRSETEAFLWRDKKNEATYSVEIMRTVVDTDSTTWQKYPSAWKITIPSENVSATLNSLGSYLQFGLPEDPQALEVYAMSTVRGAIQLGKKQVPVAGLVVSIKEE